MKLTIEELIHYTGEERAKWEHWFENQGDAPLSIPLQREPGDFQSTIGALVLHIFGPELRYVERIRREPLTEYRNRFPTDRARPIFDFGRLTRAALQDFVDHATRVDWERVHDLHVADYTIKATTRKIILHVLMHEIRHWAQVARMVREHGLAPPGEHDLLMSRALE